MFAVNRYFEQVSDDTILWRYMPFERFQSILDTGCLFFSKVTNYDEDLFEGNYNRISVDDLKQWTLTDMPGHTIDTVSEEIRGKVEQKVDNLLWHAGKVRDLVLVNCWHMSAYESVAMWKLYSNYKDGVAIRTTYGKLKESLEKYEKLMYGGAIRYIDIKKDKISFSNTLAPYATKRVGFEYERELRMVVQVEPETGFEYDWTKEDFPTGKLIPCDTQLLIDALFISPKYTQDFKVKVQQSLIEKGMNVTVETSDLNNVY